MSRVLYAIGGLGIVLASFFGALYLFDRYDIMTPDPVAAEARALIDGLEKYRLAGLPYPLAPNHPVSELKKKLAASGYASNIPEGDKDARYGSLDGKTYGFLFHINRSPANPAGTPCMIEVGPTKGNDWWSKPPPCPF